MTSTIKSNHVIQKLTMQKGKKKPKDDSSLTYNELGKKTLMTVFGISKKVEVLFWTFPNDMETALSKRTIKLGTQQIEHKGKTYDIDAHRIQNRLGKLTYNTEVNNATGALSFVKPKRSVDAKNAHDLLQRTWLTHLWSTYKMPLLIALVACIIAIAMIILTVAVFAQTQAKDQIILNLTVENTNLKNILYPPVLSNVTGATP